MNLRTPKMLRIRGEPAEQPDYSQIYNRIHIMQPRAVKTRQQILESAVRIFAE